MGLYRDVGLEKKMELPHQAVSPWCLLGDHHWGVIFNILGIPIGVDLRFMAKRRMKIRPAVLLACDIKSFLGPRYADSHVSYSLNSLKGVI